MKQDKPVYIIVHEQSANALEKQVNEAIKNGYEPIGSVVVAYAPGSWASWVQAMQLKDKEQV